MSKNFIRKNKSILILSLVCVIAVVGFGFFLIHIFKTSSLSVSAENGINRTVISVENMRRIGEWEFLNISDEELVDTTRHRLFGDDELVRIYYGELRLGINMKEMADDAIEIKGDSVFITLPKIVLLDDNFIDETRTKSFYETGKWDGKAREALYQKAKRQMKAQCLTAENKTKARENAKEQIAKMMISLGVKNVVVK
jgi:hypothetical protein